MTPAQDAAASQAEALIAVKRYPDAIAVIRRALAAAPQDTNLLGLLAQANIELGDFVTALSAAEGLIAVDPAYEWGHRLRSLALAGVGRHREGEAAAREAVRLSPSNPSAHLVLVDRLMERRRLREAESSIQRILQLAPGWFAGYDAMGRLQLRRQRFREAERYFRMALQIEPDNAAVQNNLGVTLRGRFRFLQAIQALTDAVRLDPSDEQSRRNLTQTARRMPTFPLGWALAIVVAGALLLYLAISPPLGNQILVVILASVYVAAVLGGAVVRQRRVTTRVHPAVRQLVQSEQRQVPLRRLVRAMIVRMLVIFVVGVLLLYLVTYPPFGNLGALVGLGGIFVVALVAGVVVRSWLLTRRNHPAVRQIRQLQDRPGALRRLAQTVVVRLRRDRRQ